MFAVAASATANSMIIERSFHMTTVGSCYAFALCVAHHNLIR